jgi:propionyl-CoA carboxylase alpha chain
MLARHGRFYFLEVNTRLQVEHPVTECVYGVDLVRLQIEVAEGARLPRAAPEPRGHAIEVRLYAEDPAQDWRPATGTLHTFEVPGADAEFTVPATPGLRLDSGVESGAEVGVHYDPMLAKLIAWAPSRTAAARRLAAGLRGARIHGLTTNRDLLVRILEEPAFLDGDTDTGYLDRVGLGALAAPLADEAAVRISALAAALAQAAASRSGAAVLGGLPSGWRNVRSQPQRRTFEGPHGRVDVDYDLNRGRLTSAPFPGISLVSAAPERVVLDHEGLRETFTVTTAGNRVHVDSRLGPVTLGAVPRFPDPSGRIAPGSLLAPMPGTVVRVETEAGADVAEGQVLVVIEAMKMEHRIAAPSAGTVTELNVAAGRQVESGAVLAVIERTSG